MEIQINIQNAQQQRNKNNKNKNKKKLKIQLHIFIMTHMHKLSDIYFCYNFIDFIFKSIQLKRKLSFFRISFPSFSI